MSLLLRRLVSGGKARFRDDHLDLELDLAYVTDQIIVMGFPAVGVESIYRNRRVDVQRFLSARHGADFWVFNFCPLTENAYPVSVFDGRVSRYPFPDHHVPPFLYLSLVTREMHAWVSGSKARVAVLHCKAGKGRSGTLACAHLLTLHAPPSAPAASSGHEGLDAWSFINHTEGSQTPSESKSAALPPVVEPPSVPVCLDLARVSSEPAAGTLEQVLDLHTSKRMEPRYRPARKPKMGVSIPSQQRWLSYWSQALAGKGPLSLQLPLGDHAEIASNESNHTKIKLMELKVRMREPSRLQPHLVQAASTILASAGRGHAVSESATGRLWASLARYSDQLVEELEHWENESRSNPGMMDSSPFRDDRWDKAKMVHNFAHMGLSNVQPTRQNETERSVWTYVLRPMNESEGDWVDIHVPVPDQEEARQDASVLGSSLYDYVPAQMEDETPSGIVLDANRELRIKLFLGKVVYLV